MNIKKIYKSIFERKELWDYYNNIKKVPDLTNSCDCCDFITDYIKLSEKSNTLLSEYIGSLKQNSAKRLSHIVSTFFFGLWLFHHKTDKFIRDRIINELGGLSIFNGFDDINKQFTFVWFMAALFHDLGYPAEETKAGVKLPDNQVLFENSVPCFYETVYKDYYNYRNCREHGIYAGLIFDRDVCKIREFQERPNSDSLLRWDKELEILYHYVAWIIMSHNIWMKRDSDPDILIYRQKNLTPLILSSEKNSEGMYKDYKIAFKDYPLFSFFCIIDTIEPMKSTTCLSNVDIRLKGNKIIIKTNDIDYQKKILSLNEWLTPTFKDGESIKIDLG